jgi:hypothetical protein
LQVVVLHPDDGTAVGVVGGGVGEPAVDPLVRLPPPAVELRRLDRVVVQRPERGVRVPLVVLLVVRLRQRHGPHADAVEVGHVRRRVDASGPADPRSTAFAQNRMESGDEPTRAAAPLRRAVGMDALIHRKTVG